MIYIYRYLMLIAVAAAIGLALPSKAFASGQCDSPEDIHQSKMERYALDRVPSILDECGIGAMIDLCGNPFLKIIGRELGLCGSGGGGGQSNFCDFAFDLKNLKKIYKDYKNFNPEDSGGGQTYNYDKDRDVDGIPRVLHALAGVDVVEPEVTVKNQKQITTFELLGLENL